MNLKELVFAFSVSILICPSTARAEDKIPQSKSSKLPKVTDKYPDMNNVLQKGLPGMCNSSRLLMLGNMGDLSNPSLQLSYIDAIGNLNYPSKPRDEVDETTETAWIKWNNKVASEVNKAFSSLNERVEAQDKLVVSKASYVVTKDGKIQDISVSEVCPSDKFRSMIVSSLESLNGNASLKFPPGASWKTVQKTGRFVQNYGPSIAGKTRSPKK